VQRLWHSFCNLKTKQYLFKTKHQPMNIQFDKTSNVSAELTISFEKADYQERVEKALKDYRKKAALPGFRPGQVPLSLMKKRFGLPQDAFQPTHVFFGSHLASNAETVCIVEAEKSAVILSELYPQYTWLAAGGLGELQPQKFWSLRRHKVILFPDTDPDLKAYTTWYDVAQQVMRSFYWPRGNPIHVSDFLELHATPEQKRRKIDLVDYILDNKTNIQPSV
jgi:hypothetical protein